MLEYPAKLSRGGDVVIVKFRDFPTAHTSGGNHREALARAIGALEEELAFRIANREDIPEPSFARSNESMIVLPTLTAAKVLLYRTMRAQQVRRIDLARKLGFDPRQVDRLIDLNHHSRLDQIDRALSALGKRLSVTLRDAA